MPVIVSNVGGLPEVVQEGKSGFIMESENPKELANILEKNLNTNKLKVMSDYIKDYKKRFSWDKFIYSIEKLYNRI